MARTVELFRFSPWSKLLFGEKGDVERHVVSKKLLTNLPSNLSSFYSYRNYSGSVFHVFAFKKIKPKAIDTCSRQQQAGNFLFKIIVGLWIGDRR